MKITEFAKYFKIIKISLDIICGLKYNNQVANINAAMAQEVERILGKDEVTSSTLVSSSTNLVQIRNRTRKPLIFQGFFVFLRAI